jgi:hypothetical protein
MFHMELPPSRSNAGMFHEEQFVARSGSTQEKIHPILQDFAARPS